MGKQRPHGGGKRLIVYVDAQLRYSKRFDPDGIHAEYPEFFAPMPRRGSSSSSIVSMHSERSSSEPKDEGQLRYWTSDMCSRSPHLFDFVVTVSPTSIPTNINYANIPVPLLSSLVVTAPSSSLPGSSNESCPLCYPFRWARWASSQTSISMTTNP